VEVADDIGNPAREEACGLVLRDRVGVAMSAVAGAG